LGADVYATDLFPYFFDEYADHVESLGGPPIGGRYQMELQDARQLTYPDKSFDKVYSISVLEHIEDRGDTSAIREIARVLKPGGVCCITVPFSAHYYESTIDYELYYKKPVDGGPVFFERHYDPASLRTRILEPSGLVIREIQYFGERWFPYERIGNSLPRLLKIGMLPFGPLFSALFLHRLRENSLSKAKAALLVLQKCSQP
jgi:SAM-dependent methyltransferase